MFCWFSLLLSISSVPPSYGQRLAIVDVFNYRRVHQAQVIGYEQHGLCGAGGKYRNHDSTSPGGKRIDLEPHQMHHRSSNIVLPWRQGLPRILRWDSERDLNVESKKMATTISRDRYSRFIVMDTVGIEANIQQAIMDPKFKSVKLMEHWLKESKIVPGGG